VSTKSYFYTWATLLTLSPSFGLFYFLFFATTCFVYHQALNHHLALMSNATEKPPLYQLSWISPFDQTPHKKMQRNGNKRYH
jgi:hypothetical protein